MLIVPAEDAPHERTFMMWPVSRKVHSDRFFLELVQENIADIANAISEFEPVTLLAAEEHHMRARSLLSERVELWGISTEDLWCRDAGPLLGRQEDGSLAVSHIQFNGWGDKQLHHHDARVAVEVAERLGIAVIPSGVIGEAGGVEHDGNGLLMAHESSWVNPNRNPYHSRSDIEALLLEAYGAEQMIWSEGVLGEDITDYHIDSLARFTSPGRVLINLPERIDRKDPFHVAAVKTHKGLIEAGLDIDVVYEPRRVRVKQVDFVASYANYYVCNGGLIAAQFGDDERDALAENILQQHYPEREIVMLNIDLLGELGGGIHCATQQMPVW